MYWYNQDIEWLHQQDVVRNKRKNIVFYGSSTFTLWKNMKDDFSKFNAINMGFGGATLAACAWFYSKIIPRLHPDAIFVYAGDNDLGDGRTPEEVVLFYYQLVAEIQKHHDKIPVCFISIKLSPSREHLRGSIEYANKCIREYIESEPPKHNLYYIDVFDKMLDMTNKIRNELFELDGLHLSRLGYELWIEEINKKYTEIFNN
ncbi:MAG: GDSL-type esterase/lipase family protein [Bacteroidota bacterium]|nr:GDSL-type esterase/lipase family protein [Bacteroidota bacterium]